ncbi:MAG: ABC-type multidrug transport system, ATPase and permease component [Herbinix sp.]|nr:ABC-type multidrug transport system, ATPase and permease component [Herbinix sp.]
MEKKNYNILQNMLYVLKGVWQYNKVLMLLLVISAVFGALSQFIWIIIPKLVIGQIELEAIWQSFMSMIFILLGLLLLFSGLNTYANYHMGWRFSYVSMKYILKLNRQKNTMDYEFLESPEILDQSQLADRGAYGIEGMLKSISATSVVSVKILLSITIISTLNPLLVGLVIILSAAYYIVLNLTIKSDKLNSWDKLAPFWRKIWYTKHVNINFEYAKDTRLYAMDDFLMDKQRDINQTAHKLIMNSKIRWIRFGIFYNSISMILELVLYIVLIYYALHKGLTISNFALYFASIKSFSASLDGVLYSMAVISDQSRRINDYRSFTEYEMTKPAATRNISEIMDYCFKFVNVSFRYPGQEKYALKNLNITIDPKTRLAVVGLNGAGKTTFIKLLLRLYEPTEGRILLDGIDINEFDKEEYYTLFAPLFQNIELFAFPLSENVSMKTPAATDKKKAHDVLWLAGLKDKLKSLKKGVDTELLKILYDDGIDLSGGEKQKLALARAMYKDAPVIVLDEPTSALDALAEYHLYQNFDKIIHNKTAVYISHRLSSTRFCDAIAMFDNGCMIEYGTHDELIKRSGSYKNMFDIQASYYQEEKEDCIDEQ